MKKLILPFVLLLITFFVYSQDEDRCRDVLIEGIRDTYKQSNSYYQNLALMIDISTMSYSTFKSKFKGGASLPIKGIPLSGSMSQDKYNQSQQKLRKRLEYYNLTKSKSSVFVLAANKDQLKAWRKCMKNKEGHIELIVSPVDVSNGIYDFSFYWNKYPTARPKFLNCILDDNLKLIDPNKIIKRKKEIKPNAKQILRLELIDPSKSATFTVNTSIGSKSFFIPGKKKVSGNPPVLTKESMERLRNKIDRLVSKKTQFDSKEYNDPIGSHCWIKVNEQFINKELAIDETMTHLVYTYECQRPDFTYRCGDDRWISRVNQSFNGTVKADLDYKNGVVYLKNLKLSEDKKHNFSEGKALVESHFKGLKSFNMELEFVEKAERK